MGTIVINRPSLKEHLLEIVKKKRRNNFAITKAFRTTQPTDNQDPSTRICEAASVDQVGKVGNKGQMSPSDGSTINTT